MGTTETGYENANGQKVLGPSDLTSNHHNQRLFEMSCTHCGCGYNANGCDIHIRRCPSCQNGKPSSEAL
ncbi:hypothetical protein JAN5088_02367 [Jannaschia rubra]|uniref:Uncharacterized protein n=1 Tax=Jannaschia rubra TaxID=282197 RepID=A0A0M6XTS6_9RHOB|nr:hypothetical protein JAN5088_02367 [Jannaschia rubra]SFG04400.1 hypothetical protein SAMN04488517_102414 [Jannaschia rubra]